MARQLDCTSAAAVEAHLVPALIEHNGPAAVQAYFKPSPTGSTVDGLDVLHCSLRGRNLSGVKLPLPEGYSGCVVQCRQEAEGWEGNEGAASSSGGSAMGWVATSSFSQLQYYNHDAAPLKGDGLRRCLEWADLAALVHRPIDPEAVEAAVQQAAAAGGGSGGASS